MPNSLVSFFHACLVIIITGKIYSEQATHKITHKTAVICCKAVHARGGGQKANINVQVLFYSILSYNTQPYDSLMLCTCNILNSNFNFHGGSPFQWSTERPPPFDNFPIGGSNEI